MNTVLLCLLGMRIVQSNLVVGPMNKAVVAGQRMEMECKTNNRTKVIEWINQRHPAHKIFTNFYPDTNRIGPNFTHFGADIDSNGSGFIYTNSTRLEDAGNYTCRVQEGQQQPVPYSAQLIVLEKDPLCETNQSSVRQLTGKETSWFMCRVNFSGNWAPTMEWRQHCRDSTTVLTDGVVTTIIRDSSVTSTLSLTVHSIVHSNSLCNLSCKTYFTRNISNTNTAIAYNVPDYSYIWNFYESQGTRMFGSETAIDHNSPSEGSQVTTMPGIYKGDKEKYNTGLTVLAVILTIVGLVVLMVVFYRLWSACSKRRITAHTESAIMHEVNKKSQDKDFEIELPSSNNMDIPQNENEALAAIFAYLITVMWTWLALSSTRRMDFNASIRTDDENGTDCYDTLRVPTGEVPPPVNSRQRVSIDEYAEVPICDDVAIYSDVRSNVVWPTGRPHWTPHYCGFVSTEPSPPIILTKTEDCAGSIDPSYEMCVNSRTPKRPRHDRSVWFHSRTTNQANMDNALLMRQRDELQDDITHDGNYADTDDYLHFDDDAIEEKLPTVTVGLKLSNIICDNPPCEMESSYLTCRRTDSN